MDSEERWKLEKVIRKLKMFLETEDLDYLDKAISLVNEFVDEMKDAT